MRTVTNIVVLTGAGIFAESGIVTFRWPDGLREGHRVEGRGRSRCTSHRKFALEPTELLRRRAARL